MLSVARLPPTRAATAAAVSMTRTTRIILARHQRCCKQTLGFQNTLNRPRRTLSTTGMMSTPTPPPAPVGSMSMKPPRIVSRRAWQQQQQQQQQQQRHGDAAGKSNNEKSTKTANAAAPEKPWPASVRYTAYVAAVTVIPYMTAWIVSYNPTLRSLVFKEHDEVNETKKKENTTLQDYLRWQFGTEDEEEAQTTTRYDEKYEDADFIPKQFPNEWPYSIRAAQAAIRALEKEKIFVRIGILTDSSSSSSSSGNDNDQEKAVVATDGMSGPYASASLGDMQQVNNDDAAYYYHLLPGSTPARIDAIVKAMKTTASTTTSDNASRNSPFPPPFLSSLSLDFEDVPSPQTKMSDGDDDDDDDSTSASVVANTMDGNDEKTVPSSATTKQHKKQHNNDPLLKQTACFSLWHYQDAAILQVQVQAKEQRQPQNASNNSNNNNNNNNNHHDSIELARLEYQVQQFQHELNNAATSLRAVDDIRHDLQESKAALKRFQAGNRGGSWSWSLW